MATHNIRLGSMLSFDEDQEKDIIKAMEYLNATHSTGKFISNLIRIAFDNPEILDMSNGKFEKGAIVKQLDNLGVSVTRNAFFGSLAKEVDAMKKKVDAIYDMSMKTYMLAQMGKHLGLESKSNNNLLAGFVLEKQLKEIQDMLGVTLGSTPFESSKLDVAHKRADDALEYIIETYDSLLTELKTQFEITKIDIPVQQVVNTAPAESVVSTSVSNTVTENTPVVASVVSTENKSSDDELVDFGSKSVDNFEVTNALMGFFDSFEGN